AYRRAIKRGELEPFQNPTLYLEIPNDGEQRERFAEPKEALELIEALPELRDRAAWEVSFHNPRWSETIDLEVSDVGEVSIRVDSSWDKIEGSGETKTQNGVRETPKIERLTRNLDTYIESLGRSTCKLFTEPDGSPFSYGKFRRRSEAAWKDAGLTKITPHGARRSWRTWIDSIPAISEMRADRYMGHSDGHVRGRYIRISSEQIAKDAAALDA